MKLSSVYSLFQFHCFHRFIHSWEVWFFIPFKWILAEAFSTSILSSVAYLMSSKVWIHMESFITFAVLIDFSLSWNCWCSLRIEFWLREFPYSLHIKIFSLALVIWCWLILHLLKSFPHLLFIHGLSVCEFPDSSLNPHSIGTLVTYATLPRPLFCRNFLMCSRV